MKQNKLLYNIVKIANTAGQSYKYNDMPEEFREVMAEQHAAAKAQQDYQNQLRRQRLAQYIRDGKMLPDEALSRYQAAQKQNYTTDPNYIRAAEEFPHKSSLEYYKRRMIPKMMMAPMSKISPQTSKYGPITKMKAPKSFK